MTDGSKKQTVDSRPLCKRCWQPWRPTSEQTVERDICGQGPCGATGPESVAMTLKHIGNVLYQFDRCMEFDAMRAMNRALEISRELYKKGI